MDKYPKPPQLTSLTVIDRNPEMIKLAWTKYLRLSRNGKDVTTYLPKTTFHVMDAEAAASIPSGQFDTVVDTFGLCSCDDPARIVLEMKRVCKKEGTLLFLEHGRSSWTVAETVSKLINEILDKGSIDHARSWGCWWNRDIEKIIRDAGLIVEQDKRYHFGTTYYIVARNASLS